MREWVGSGVFRAYKEFRDTRTVPRLDVDFSGVWPRAASWKHRRNLNRRAELCLLRRPEGEF